MDYSTYYSYLVLKKDILDKLEQLKSEVTDSQSILDQIKKSINLILLDNDLGELYSPTDVDDSLTDIESQNQAIQAYIDSIKLAGSLN
jgi:hypothetical protein